MVLVGDVVCEREGLMSLTVVDLQSEWQQLSRIAIVGIATRSLRHTLQTNCTCPKLSTLLVSSIQYTTIASICS
jgi:hypothetical protein